MVKKLNFVTFEDFGGKFTSYKISLGKHGGFGFNSGFYKKEDIRKYSHVLLSYDKNNNAVGFRFTNDKNLRGVYKIIHTANVNSASVVVHSFFGAHGINYKEYADKYDPKEYSDPQMGKLYYIILKKHKKKVEKD